MYNNLLIWVWFPYTFYARMSPTSRRNPRSFSEYNIQTTNKHGIPVDVIYQDAMLRYKFSQYWNISLNITFSETDTANDMMERWTTLWYYSSYVILQYHFDKHVRRNFNQNCNTTLNKTVISQ